MSTTITITRRYDLIAGHYLPKVPEGHKCRGQHGHNYVIEFTLGRGGKPTTQLDKRGFVADFDDDLDAVVVPLLAKLDHKNLNDIEGLENPTAEIIADWFMQKLGGSFKWPVWLISVSVYETPDCWATAKLV